MKLLGQYDTSGIYLPFTEAVDVHAFGATLRDNDGMVWGIKDDYGDWVNRDMLRLGIKVKLRIIDVEEGYPNQPPCIECGAMTPEESETKCICGGDKDNCHGCYLWPD